MPYEEDYKMWLEKMLIESNPDWVCDGMSNKKFTRHWCHQYCGEDDAYITPKCLHMYYHHIERADRKTENSSEIPNNCEVKNYCDDCLYTDTCDSKEFFYACTSKATISKMEQVKDDAYFLELMGAVERGEISDAEANQAWYEYINQKDEPQMEEEKVREVVRGFMNIVNDMRNPTEEEKESVNKYIESISKPTGVNVFELMDEPQTEREGER